VDAVGYLSREAIPDFILMDVSMPVMDGYQLCKTIKQMPNGKHVPIVMLSGNDGFIDKVKGRMAGAADYLLKPFNAKTLLGVVKKLTQERSN
jgi:CheY-like chemotaxis protein